MSCPNATGPVNIIHTETSCFNKCRLRYNFQKTGVTATHQNNYISIEPNNKNTPNVVYSSANTPVCRNGGEGNFAVEDIRIYQPSLHTYGKKETHADGEVIIHLNNLSGGRNLVICIAITRNNGTQNSASRQVASIISYLQKMGNSVGEGGTVQGLNFDLNDFMPKGKGFYTYIASMPYTPCLKCVDFVVYDINDAALSLGEGVIADLVKLINKSTIPVKKITDGLGYAYNQTGAEVNTSNDEIYIDCQPTGDSGSTMINENKEDIIDNNPFRTITHWRDKINKKYGKNPELLAWTGGGIFILWLILTKLPAPKLSAKEVVNEVAKK